MAAQIPIPEALSLAGKNAIVTGGARGIGAAITLELAKRGANVAIGYQSEGSTPKAEEIAKSLEKLGRASTLIKIDLSSEDVGNHVVDKALKGLGAKHIDILVNNAAQDQEPGLSSEWDPKTFDRIMHVNVRAPMLLLKAVAPHLPERGGRIISISSTQARQPAANMATYASSKAALECLSKYWASELGRKHNLTSNIVEVAVVATDWVQEIPDSDKEELMELPSAERRLGQPGDISEIVAFLASDSARWINGDTIAGNGGSAYM